MAGQRNWGALREEFIRSNHTFESFSQHVAIPLRTIQYHGEREHWLFERLRFREELASDLRNKAREQALTAMPALIEIDSEYIADSKGPLALLRRTVDHLAARDRLSPEAAQVLDRVEQVRERIYRNCRTACGADTLMPEAPASKYDSMSEEELQNELNALRRRDGWTPPVQ